LYHQGFSNSSRIYGKIKSGPDSFISQGAILRSHEDSITIGNNTGILENCVVVGSPDAEVHIGSKTVFGHSCIVLGATIGDLCEVGNKTLFMPGAIVGDRCIFGEATIVPENKIIPSDSVVVGRPGKIIRQLNNLDLEMIKRMRNNDITIEAYIDKIVQNEYEGGQMGTLHPFKNKLPVIGQSSIVYDTAEITGDVTIGDKCVIGSGVKIIGDSHGPVIIGDNVQILENTVLHLLPGNQLIIKDNTIIGPGCVIHGTIVEKGCVVESNATVCDNSHIGENSLIKAGSLVKQNSNIEDNSIVEGFPAKIVGKVNGKVKKPMWAFNQS
jgi:carbonic anhydrase/acetyltransferase-like protein (isoleucine patch superfamily)